ncbi:MFS general substrate transporter [Fomitopsis serialis]|uniref:MFS general substrate transporter n=1 Tax=Fomitopsis serialis TaxID=139415 RepID=UPI002007F357|nr:MFS general substrate transporter [Neoantrodia serialis]KAH9938279.1 MFS general substrate transporter [Neoantrodia serialis]
MVPSPSESLGMEHQDATLAQERVHREMDRRVLWKLDLHVLPPLTLLWLANFIDRTNVGNAKIAGLTTDLHLYGTQFNIALAVFYAPYILVELPSNWILKRAKPSRWLPIIVAVWGMVTTLSGVVQDYSGLIAIRFFLGFCEGGLLPGIILYLSTIYKRHELQTRVGIFYASASLSGAFGGLLATGIEKMDGIGGLAGWRWIFILEGLITILFAVIAAVFLPADIGSAKFFTEEERDFALNRFREENNIAASAPLSEPAQRINVAGAQLEKVDEVQVETLTTHSIAQSVNQEDEQFEWLEVVRGIKEPQVWMSALSYLGIIISLYSFSLFLPTIVAGLGYSGGQAQLTLYLHMSLLQSLQSWSQSQAIASAYAVHSFYCSFPLQLPVRDRPHCSLISRFSASPIGYILAIVAKNNTQRYAAVFLIASGIYPCGPCILSILPNNTAGHYKKATAVALQLAVANTGGFVATFVYTNSQAPKYIRGHTITVSFLAMAWVAMFANVMYCALENRARAAGRRQGNLIAYQELWDTGKTRAPIGDRHPEFRFTL